MTDWNALLEAEIDASAAQVDSEALGRLVKYLTLMEKWNKVTNLVSATTAPREMVSLHVADCLALLPHLGDTARRLVDVGSGGGLPAAVLAIARPALAVTALEPLHKKHSFLAAVRRDLSLDNFTPLAERDDHHRVQPGFLPYDAAVSRAVFALADWLPRGAALVRPGGRVLGMEGREPIQLPPGAIRHRYRLGDRQRAIIEWPR